MGKRLEFLRKVAVVAARNAGVAMRKLKKAAKAKKKKTSRRKSKR